MRSVGEVHEIIGRIPYMTIEQAEAISSHIQENDIKTVLELGFYHGASTSYLANAICDKDDGRVVCVDKERAKTLDPNVEGLLSKLGLREKVDVYYEPTSYIWRLMKMLEEHEEPKFDLCYLDGAHNWFVDGFAFFLVDRLLKPGGWIIMDDLNWRYADSVAMRGSETLQEMPDDEVYTYQLRKVYELIIQRQPGYGNFREEFNWGFAQKISDFQGSAPHIETKVVVKERRVGVGEALVKAGRRLGLK